jgi:DNA modification methylase
MKLQNTIYCGDNLEWMRKMPDEFVDLCYIDPPFFSNRYHEVIFDDGEEIRSFEDRWKGGIHNYIEWMKERIFEIHRVLKVTGSFYLHCDWHASHYLKTSCDEIFDINNFQNEIIWYYRGGGISKKRFGRRHDIIFFYTKSNK